MATRRQSRYDYLINAGFVHSEAMFLLSKYSMKEFRKYPYLVNMVRSRRLYRANAQKAKLTYRQYKDNLIKLYQRKKWVNSDGDVDYWRMIRAFRKEVSDSGGTPSPGVSPKKSHHGEGVSKGDIDGQRLRARYKEKTGSKPKGIVTTILNDISDINVRIRKERNQAKKENLIEKRNELWKRIS